MFKTALKVLAGSAKPLRILAANFRANSRANVAIITGIAAIPMVSAVGCVVDYSMASMIRTKLQAAADAATLATVSKNSPIVTTAKTMVGNGSVSGGSTYATNFFGAETTAFTGTNPGATVTKTGAVISATATYSYQVPTFFMKVVGFPNITVSGSSTASFTLPAYINFYLMLDVSGSMSFPSTTTEMTRLMAVNPDNSAPGEQSACQRLSAGVPVRLPFQCARNLLANPSPKLGRGKRTVARIMALCGPKYPEPMAQHLRRLPHRRQRRVLYGIYHYAPGNKRRIPSRLHQQPAPVHQRQQHASVPRQRETVGLRPICELDQQPGQLVPQSWDYVVHPVARRCRRLCGERVAEPGGDHRDQ